MIVTWPLAVANRLERVKTSADEATDAAAAAAATAAEEAEEEAVAVGIETVGWLPPKGNC